LARLALGWGPQWHGQPPALGPPRPSTHPGRSWRDPGRLSRSDERWCRSQRRGAGQRVPACTYVPAPGPASALPPPPPPERHLRLGHRLPDQHGPVAAGQLVTILVCLGLSAHICTPARAPHPGRLGPWFSGQRLHPAPEENSRFPTKTLAVRWPGFGSSAPAATPAAQRSPARPALSQRLRPRLAPPRQQRGSGNGGGR